jgi:hypothetical protein
MTLPEVKWAGLTLKDVGVTSQTEGTFERTMSRMMAAPIVGSLAGNVLKNFRVELDYPNQKLYLSAKSRYPPERPTIPAMDAARFAGGPACAGRCRDDRARDRGLG